MKTERWWKDDEKNYLLERYQRQFEREDEMRKLRQFYYHAQDEFRLILWAFALLLAGSLLWILADKVLGCLR